MHYQGVAPSTLRHLQGFVKETDHVTAAPNPTVKPKLVAIAWFWKMECNSFDAKALRGLFEPRQPAGPVSD